MKIHLSFKERSKWSALGLNEVGSSPRYVFRRWRLEVLWFGFLFLFGVPANAATWFVDSQNTSATQNGFSWATAFTSIQAGVDAAFNDVGGEVWVRGGTYTSTTTTVVTLKADVALYGGFSGIETSRDDRDWTIYQTVIDGETLNKGVRGASNARLDGFTVTRCRSNTASILNANGGGMYNNAPNMIVANCTFSQNLAKNGGGAFNDGGSDGTVFTNCDFVGNMVTGSGGGLAIGESSSPTITSCTFTGNTADYGGAVSIKGSSLFTGCVFTDNQGMSQGGAVYNAGYFGVTFPTYLNCTFSYNSSVEGGVMIGANGAVPTLLNCILSNNSAARGGAFYNLPNADPILINCTLSANTASDRGGALYNASNSLTGSWSRPGLTNTILWGNLPTDYYSKDADLMVVNHCIIGGGYPSGTGVFDVDPQFEDSISGDFRLKPESIAIDTGTAADAPSADILGIARPQGLGVDIGAYEFLPGPPLCLDHSPVWSGNEGISYSLPPDDLHVLQILPNYEFGHTRAGNFVASGISVLGIDTLFVLDDELTPDDLESELFITSKLPLTENGWHHIPWSEVSNVRHGVNANGSISWVQIVTPSGYSGPFYLFRYLHFSPLGLNSSASNFVVLIHGWNRVGNRYPYQDQSGPWFPLWLNLSTAAVGSLWQVKLYDWAIDASTGGFTDWPAYLGVNAAEAAEIGHLHGLHLGERMLCEAPNLSKVQLIAHSAGSWVARSAARILTQAGVEVQVTLLDPFVPKQVRPNSALDIAKLDQMSQLPGIFKVENYFVEDESDFLYSATSQVFSSWSQLPNLNAEVDLDLQSNVAQHDDPIRWYSKTLEGVANLPTGFSVDAVGWQSGLAYPETNLPEVWCQFSYLGAQDGSVSQPVNTVFRAVLKARFGGTVKIVSGSTVIEPTAIGKPMTIEAVGGLVRITGQTPARSTGGLSRVGFVSARPK